MLTQTRAPASHLSQNAASTGPSATDKANVRPGPRAPGRSSARSVNVSVMIDVATRLSMMPPTTCTIRNAVGPATPGADCADQSRPWSTASPTSNMRSAARPSRGRGQHRRRLADTSMCRRRRDQSQAGHASVQVPANEKAAQIVDDGGSTPTMNSLGERSSAACDNSGWTSTSRHPDWLVCGSNCLFFNLTRGLADASLVRLKIRHHKRRLICPALCDKKVVTMMTAIKQPRTTGWNVTHHPYVAAPRSRTLRAVCLISRPNTHKLLKIRYPKAGLRKYSAEVA